MPSAALASVLIYLLVLVLYAKRSPGLVVSLPH